MVVNLSVKTYLIESPVASLSLTFAASVTCEARASGFLGVGKHVVRPRLVSAGAFLVVLGAFG